MMAQYETKCEHTIGSALGRLLGTRAQIEEEIRNLQIDLEQVQYEIEVLDDSR